MGGAASVSSAPGSDAAWRDDPELLDARHRKSAAVLVALARVLAARRPLGGGEDEFLDLYRQVAAADPAVFTRVWTEPRAYLWLRVAHQLLGACLGGAPPSALAARAAAECGAADAREALAAHLEDFKELALAVALAGGGRLRLATPLAARLPFTLTGARWTLEGAGAVTVVGTGAGRVDVVLEGGERALPLDDLAAAPRAVGAATLFPAPIARHGGAELVMAPAAFNVPGLDIRDAALAAGREFQAARRGLVEAALAAMERYAPAGFALFRTDMRHLVLKRREEGPFTNVSYTELPGACFVAAVARPLVLADRLLHEHTHNRLFALEEGGALFEPGSGAATDARHYSPWRDDPRPLQGLLHAVAVYLAVARFWLAVHRAGAAVLEERRYAIERLVRVPRQLALATATLERHARFTARGRGLFRALGAELRALDDAIAAADVPPDVAGLMPRDDGTFGPYASAEGGRPLSARAAVAEHLRLCGWDAGA